MKRRVLRLIALLTAVFLLTGCQSGTSDPGMTPEESELQESIGDGLTFEATDLDGNPVSSDVFGESRLTLLNVWGTFCQPCLQEMPGLGKLAADYDPKECQIIGVLCDVEAGASDDIDYAKELVEETQANYVHLTLNQSLNDAFLQEVTAVPTTYFVNAKGEVLDVKVGARSEDAWKQLINGYLEQA